MDVETPNVSATTNDERTPLINRTPRARITKPAAWVWAIVMVTCLAGVIFLGVSGNLHQRRWACPGTPKMRPRCTPRAIPVTSGGREGHAVGFPTSCSWTGKAKLISGNTR